MRRRCTKVFHLVSVATTKPHIALLRDEELDRALSTTREALPPENIRSTAAHVRFLALLGARAIESERVPRVQAK